LNIFSFQNATQSDLIEGQKREKKKHENNGLKAIFDIACF